MNSVVGVASPLNDLVNKLGDKNEFGLQNILELAFRSWQDEKIRLEDVALECGVCGTESNELEVEFVVPVVWLNTIVRIEHKKRSCNGK